MSKNKLQKFSDLRAMSHVLQPPFSDVLQQRPFALRGRWQIDFFHNDHPIVLELGCGKGEYTVEQAAADSNKNFIGIDVKGARIWAGAVDSLRRQLTNVAFVRIDICNLPYIFAPSEVSEIWITFPDPQMQKVRKRLTSTRFMQIYRRVLQPDGRIHLKTDSRFLYTYTCAMAALNHLPVIEQTDDLYNSPWAECSPQCIRTYYEQQWLARGITIKYLTLSLPCEGSLTEPNIDIPRDTYRTFGRDERSKVLDSIDRYKGDKA